MLFVPAHRPPALVAGAAAALAALGAGAQVLAGFNGHVSAWQWFWLVMAALAPAGGVCLASDAIKKNTPDWWEPDRWVHGLTYGKQHKAPGHSAGGRGLCTLWTNPFYGVGQPGERRSAPGWTSSSWAWSPC